jgi:hypothetical protein
MILSAPKSVFARTTTLILTAFCAWAVLQTSLAQTNLAEELNIDLTVTIAGAPSSNTAGDLRPVKVIRLDKTDVMAALGASLGTVFSPKAQLSLALTPAGDDLVTVTDGTNMAVDVSGYFSFDTASNRVESVSFSRYAGAVRTNVFALETFGFQNRVDSRPLPWHFSVTGVSETECDGINSEGTATNFLMTADVSGSGDYNGAFALFQGSIRADPAHGLILVPFGLQGRSSRGHQPGMQTGRGRGR